MSGVKLYMATCKQLQEHKDNNHDHKHLTYCARWILRLKQENVYLQHCLDDCSHRNEQLYNQLNTRS